MKRAPPDPPRPPLWLFSPAMPPAEAEKSSVPPLSLPFRQPQVALDLPQHPFGHPTQTQLLNPFSPTVCPRSSPDPLQIFPIPLELGAPKTSTTSLVWSHWASTGNKPSLVRFAFPITSALLARIQPGMHCNPFWGVPSHPGSSQLIPLSGFILGREMNFPQVSGLIAYLSVR